MIALAAAANPGHAVRVALQVPDPLRHRQLQRALAVVPEETAEVLVVALGPGEALQPRARMAEAALLVLSDDPALAADAALPGVLPAAATPAQVAAAVAAIAEGLSVRVPGGSRESPEFVPPEPARPLLTPREVEILALVGQGQSNKAIARRLGISAHTVKYHLESVFTKLGASSRAEAVTTGLRRGLLIV
ncbi:Helix-turn-helix transcriptional regulator [Rhodovastum atsumiense]|uniref:Helix-turn-helix transcriptional regulator n=1 Tax=Rhodovastum atsumiense TaxID=504468 RepID=A0A5M6IKQ2_9PROT|nr:helix-turn-helix transcriptional regulator [Rhodovastum atsumiense]KAA5608138.1 helix-turn-helix transcriptional regulator [Rhodovastum atsumiense]CAH2599359.1 Helix-turn-helix transcriptional regulator [Rhodovastum atsumiense]